MAKRGLSKARQALQEARERMEKAHENVIEKKIGLNIAETTLAAYQEAYSGLEQMLLRPKPTTAPPAAKRSSKKSEGTSSTVSTATGKDNAGIVLPNPTDDDDAFLKAAGA